MNDLPDQAMINASAEKLIPVRVWESVTPIVGVFGESLRQLGSGTFFRVGTKSFVVTAAHVIHEAQKAKASICIPTADDRFIGIGQKVCLSSPGQYGHASDILDIALIELEDEQLHRLEDRHFLGLSDVVVNSEPERGLYSILGFPAIWSHESSTDGLSVSGFEYTSITYDGAVDSLGGYDERFHLLIFADPQWLTKVDGNPARFAYRSGVSAQFPGDLGGISGCCVWRLSDNPASSIRGEETSPQQPRLAAVQTSVYSKNRVIKATRWIAVSTVIHSAYPELRSVFEIIRQ